jgi:hypothetical protein
MQSTLDVHPPYRKYHISPLPDDFHKVCWSSIVLKPQCQPHTRVMSSSSPSRSLQKNVLLLSIVPNDSSPGSDGEAGLMLMFMANMRFVPCPEMTCGFSTYINGALSVHTMLLIKKSALLTAVQWEVLTFLINTLKTCSVMKNNTELFCHCKIWGFHGGDYEEWCLLGYYAMWLL